MKARNLMKLTKEGAFDRPIYEGLEPETQKFYRYLLMLGIKSARYAVEQLEEFPGLYEMKLSKKRDGINCWKFFVDEF